MATQRECYWHAHAMSCWSGSINFSASKRHFTYLRKSIVMISLSRMTSVTAALAKAAKNSLAVDTEALKPPGLLSCTAGGNVVLWAAPLRVLGWVWTPLAVRRRQTHKPPTPHGHILEAYTIAASESCHTSRMPEAVAIIDSSRAQYILYPLVFLD